MLIKPTIKMAVAILSIFVSMNAKAQGNMILHNMHQNRYMMADMEMSEELRKSSTHTEVFGALCIAPMFIEGKYNYVDGTDVRTKRFTNQIPLTTSYTIAVGTYAPMAYYGERSSLGLTFNINITTVQGKEGMQIPVNAGDTLTKLAVQTVGLPISLDYKVGCDAIFNRIYPGMYSIGVGVHPMVASVETNLYDIKALPIKVSPFIKAEAGFYLGVAVKVRVMYTFLSNLKSYDGTIPANNDYVFKGGNSAQYSGKLTTSGFLSVGLVINPFAAMWDKY